MVTRVRNTALKLGAAVAPMLIVASSSTALTIVTFGVSILALQPYPISEFSLTRLDDLPMRRQARQLRAWVNQLAEVALTPKSAEARANDDVQRRRLYTWAKRQVGALSYSGNFTIALATLVVSFGALLAAVLSAAASEAGFKALVVPFSLILIVMVSATGQLLPLFPKLLASRELSKALSGLEMQIDFSS